MEIPPQDTQAYVTLVTPLTPIPTTLQTIASLQGADRRLHPRMMLTRLAKGHRALLLLLTPLLLAFRGNTGRPHDLTQFLLILRRVKGPVERGTLDLAV